MAALKMWWIYRVYFHNRLTDEWEFHNGYWSCKWDEPDEDLAYAYGCFLRVVDMVEEGACPYPHDTTDLTEYDEVQLRGWTPNGVQELVRWKR